MPTKAKPKSAPAKKPEVKKAKPVVKNAPAAAPRTPSVLPKVIEGRYYLVNGGIVVKAGIVRAATFDCVEFQDGRPFEPKTLSLSVKVREITREEAFDPDTTRA